MTGELTLRGRVLPVGGLKEKLTAAARAGVQTVLIPARNKSELIEVPDEVTQLLDIRLVETVDDVLGHALLAADSPPPPRPGQGSRRSRDYRVPEART
jgi:ATP-dependent Lon protease